MAISSASSPSGPRQEASKRPASVGGEAAQIQAFSQLLRIESEARRTTSVRELDALAVNDGQRLLRSRQAFLIECNGPTCRVTGASSLVTIDPSSPVIRWVTTTVMRLKAERGLAGPIEFALPGFAPSDDELTRQYPFRNVLWQPHWSPDGRLSAGTIYFRETPWIDSERAIAARLAETFGHARALHERGIGARPASRIPRAHKVGALLLAVLIAAIPVPLSVLAPLEVVPRDADVIAMPIDGIVQQVLVRPNARVEVGTPLVSLVDTVPRNRAEVAAREVEVAAARVEKATSLALSDPRGREELGIARADLALKRAELAYAREVLAQTVIVARSQGIAVFSDPRELEGKPFSTGDRLMLVARESEVELKISLPVADSIVLRPGLAVKGFLDTDPLNSVAATITAIDRHVRIDETQIASYRITARVLAEGAKMTLGARGTARIQGENVPLVLFVLRRPLSALRQWIGL